jgi:hypothetical protein
MGPTGLLACNRSLPAGHRAVPRSVREGIDGFLAHTGPSIEPAHPDEDPVHGHATDPRYHRHRRIKPASCRAEKRAITERY